jgi:hypothetical protein
LGVCRGIADYFNFSVFYVRAIVVVVARHDTAERFKRKWRHLEKRIRTMEDKVTSREFDWNSRFHG